MCSDTLRHYALLRNSSHEPLAIYMISNNRKKCLEWKWNSIFDYYFHHNKSMYFNSICSTLLENCLLPLLQIIRLESERTQWEQRYLEESAMRQVAIDAASIPKDAKIAALEKNSAESEKMIAEARSDKIKQLEEMQGTQVC